MSSFFDYRIEAPAEGATTSLVSWSKTQPVLAVAYDNGVVDFYQEEVTCCLATDRCVSGVSLRTCCRAKTSSFSTLTGRTQMTNATAMGWQPTGKLLAVGWEDGACALGLAARRLLD